MSQTTKYFKNILNCNSDRSIPSCSCIQRSLSSSSFMPSQLLRQLLCLIMLATLMQLPEARHVQHKSNELDTSSHSLPAWHVNPYHGLQQSSGESSSASSSGVDSDSGSISLYDSSSAADGDSGHLDSSLDEDIYRLRLRHRRSHNLPFFTRTKPTPEWENPCGGVYKPSSSNIADANTSSQGRVIKRKHLIELRNNTMKEYHNAMDTARIDYGNYEPWKGQYNFLANMSKPSSSIKLKRWYRHMQVFVGSFAYLGRAHYKYRMDHQKGVDRKTEELHDLLTSARLVLCEIETTINASYPNSNLAKLGTISREDMLERLKFKTPANGSQEADISDLKFSKELYKQYLHNMWRSLHRALRKHSKERKHPAGAAASSRASSGAAAMSQESGGGDIYAALDSSSGSFGSGPGSGSD